MDDLRINRDIDNQLSQPGYWQFYAPPENDSSLNRQIDDGNTLIRLGLGGLLFVLSLWLWVSFLQAGSPGEPIKSDSLTSGTAVVRRGA